MKSFHFLLVFYFSVVVLALPERLDPIELQKIETIHPLRIDAMESVSAFYNAKQVSVALGKDTENGIYGPCKPITVIYAKGTSERGNVGGKHSPGPALFNELRERLGEGNVTIQGVDYRASLFGYLMGGDSDGSLKYFDLTSLAVENCPDTKIILSGYSQGAQLAHNAAKRFTKTMTSRIAAAVMFGDPDSKNTLGYIPASRVLSICHDRDIFCNGLGGFAAYHLTYSKDAPLAAQFIVEILKTS